MKFRRRNNHRNSAINTITSLLYHSVLHPKNTNKQQLITYDTQFIFLAGCYDTMKQDGYESANHAFGLKYIDDTMNKKVPYGIKMLATALDSANEETPAGKPWELSRWKMNGVKLLNTRDAETVKSAYLFHTLKPSADSSPIFIAVFGSQNKRYIPTNISEKHEVHVYQHPTSRKCRDDEEPYKNIKTDIEKFSQKHNISVNWKLI